MSLIPIRSLRGYLASASIRTRDKKGASIGYTGDDDIETEENEFSKKLKLISKKL